MNFHHLYLDQPLAILTTLIGIGAVTVGTFSFFAPATAPQIYGIPTSDRSSAGEGNPKHSGTKSHANEQHILTQSLTVRNLVTGICILALTAFWQQNLKSSTERADAARTCLGIVILVGTAVPVVDMLGSSSAKGTQDADLIAGSAATIHALRSVIWLVGGIWCLAA